MASEGQRVLEESDVLTKARQYDAEIVFSASLKSMGLSSLGAALERCTFLTALDISRNSLHTLQGLGTPATLESLTLLNAAENNLEDITALSSIPTLERVWLEGNQLRTKEDLKPLTQLPRLTELRLTHSINIDGSPLVLDNPVCGGNNAAAKAAYTILVDELFAKVRWVDGKVFRDPLDCAAEGDEATALGTEVDKVMEALAAQKSSLAGPLPEETALRAILDAPVS